MKKIKIGRDFEIEWYIGTDRYREIGFESSLTHTH